MTGASGPGGKQITVGGYLVIQNADPAKAVGWQNNRAWPRGYPISRIADADRVTELAKLHLSARFSQLADWCVTNNKKVLAK